MGICSTIKNTINTIKNPAIVYEPFTETPIKLQTDPCTPGLLKSTELPTRNLEKNTTYLQMGTKMFKFMGDLLNEVNKESFIAQ